LTIAAFLQPNIDGREHETAMVIGFLAAAIQTRLPPWRHRTAATPGPSQG
jgi:hypothetical protein